jgi:energy-converting hydrogenase A subunit M
MNSSHSNPAVRKGQFLWRDRVAQVQYIDALKKRISDNYYFSDQVFSRIADELAPVIEEIATCR